MRSAGLLIVAVMVFLPAHVFAGDMTLSINGGKIIVDRKDGEESRTLSGSFRQAVWMAGAEPTRIAAVTPAGNVEVIDLVAGKHKTIFSEGDALIVSAGRENWLTIACKNSQLKILDLVHEEEFISDLSGYGVIDDLNTDTGCYALMHTGSGKQTVSRIVILNLQWSVTNVLVTPSGVCLKAICWSKCRNALLVAGMASTGTFAKANSSGNSVDRLAATSRLLSDIAAGRREIFIAQLPLGSRQVRVLYTPYTNAEQDWSVVGMAECSDGGIIIGLLSGGEGSMIYTTPPPDDQCDLVGEGLWPCAWRKQ